jgi:hypothetical protein
MSLRLKILLAVALALFAGAHLAGVFMLGSHATERAPAALLHHGD